MLVVDRAPFLFSNTPCWAAQRLAEGVMHLSSVALQAPALAAAAAEAPATSSCWRTGAQFQAQQLRAAAASCDAGAARRR